MITKAEIGDLLTIIVAFDRRTVGDADIEAWHLILADLELTDCAQAVRDHYTERRDWLMPADVHTRATHIARRRAGRAKIAELEAQEAAENEAERLALASEPAANREALAEQLRRGAITSRRLPHVDTRHPDTIRAEARRELDARRPDDPGPARETRTSDRSDPATPEDATPADLSMEVTHGR